MRIRTFTYYVKEALKSLKRNGLMSVASISTVTVSLFMLGVFLCGIMNINNLASHLESQVQISVYLRDGLTTEQIMGVGKQLKSLPNKKELKFVNKDEAMQRFKERLGADNQLITVLDGMNPLPNAYEITLNDPQDVPRVADEISQIPEVESTHYGKEIVEDLFKISQVIRIGGIVLMVFLAGATLFIISNTIRLTVFARRKEIGIMKLVGATNSFIRWPFLLEGLFIGFIGAAIAAGLTWQFYEFLLEEVRASLAFLPILPPYPFLYELMGIIFVSGIIVGALGSTISLKQYMKV